MIQLECKCGRTHEADIEKIIIEKNGIQQIPTILKEDKIKKILLICDENTYRAAGKEVEEVLQQKQIAYKLHNFHREGELIPDERAVGELLVALEKDADAIAAIGSGTLNDLARYISYRMEIPYYIVATAPSMDGFASTASPLIVNHVKTTYYACSPKGIICDINILKTAPMEMIAAGVGDILGKYTALCDWKISSIITGEYYCEEVAEMVKKSVDDCICNIDKICEKDEEGMGQLANSLVLSGVAMSYVGTSRPASGSEHHLSHFWEMMKLLKGEAGALHGIKVGISTRIMIQLYQKLLSAEIDFEEAKRAIQNFSKKQWEEEIKEVYGAASAGVIELEKEAQRNTVSLAINHLEAMEENWEEICEVIQSFIPGIEKIDQILGQLKAPMIPREIHVEDEMQYHSILYAKEVRSRYTILQLLWEIGVLKEWASSATIDQ